MTPEQKEANRLRAARWREKNPEKKAEQGRRYRARLAGEEIPYLKPQTVPLEVQRAKKAALAKRWNERRKELIRTDPEYRAKILATKKRSYRRARGLPEDAVLSMGRNSDPQKAARIEAARAAKRAAKDAKMAARKQEREEARKLKAREKAIAKLALERARRAAEVEAAKAIQPIARPVTQRQPEKRRGRLAALAGWNRL